MGSKSAVNNVLNHIQPEYIPLGTYAIDCDTAARLLGRETYVRNRIKTQIALWEGRRDEVAQSLKEDSVELFNKLDVIDVIIVFKETMLLPPVDYVPPKVRQIDDESWETEDGYVYKCSYLTNDITCVSGPARQNDENMYEDIDEENDEYDQNDEIVINAPDDSVFEAYDHLVEHMKDKRFLAGSSGGFSVMALPGGMQNGLMQYYLRPNSVKKEIAHSTEVSNRLDKYHIRGGEDQVFVEFDGAITAGPLLPPEMFREFCLPAMKKRIKNIKKYRDKVMMHSCGNTWKMLNMFCEAGVDCYQSLQTGAGMDMKRLKDEYGDKLCFWGGVSVENLIAGTMEEVRNDVRYAIRHGAPGGGFILGPSHSIAYGTKYENFMAMLDEHSKLKYYS